MTALTPGQLAGLARAVARKSLGQVSLPPVAIDRAEAIALWHEVAASFDNAEGRLLAARDLDRLRRRSWQVSHGYAALGEASLSVEAGHAFWRLALRLGKLAEQRKAGGLARAASVAALGLAATQLAACTSLFGGNIKGNFACSAPNGTCAPSTVIDDQALSVIQNARPMTPAGPYMRTPASPRAITAAYVPTGSGRITPAQGGMAHRERRVLRVVFPSFVDGGGNLHEPRIVHAVVDDGAWMQLSGSEPTAIDQIEGRSASLASAAFTPPTLPDAATLPSDLSSAPEVKATPAGPPSPEAVAAARAKGAALKAGSAIDAIRAEVQGRLAQTAKAPGAVPPVAPPAPAAAHNAAPADAGRPAPLTAAPVNGPTAFPAKVEE
ncbi:hypothetical protein H7F50_11175 [Novosphingobium flavum]|uniref:Conjugal transfer pilus assembly protein TraV n=1 Tax=Novosphingobium aerophilum TaxID=2839843 RepID=A0A7X1F9G1_9SPHN|nr:hypothetical protein [Novosphingobium aerophilum]MBC2652409.1 hypothetical protein [Novosphingobium aerophilum]MBC2662318.1 hypothetical protein [Novosphingobium aerophilum]